MAARDPLGAHPAALEQAVAFDRLFGVARAGRLVAAARGQPEERRSVEMNCADSESLQFVPVVAVVSSARRPADVISRVSTSVSSACVACAAGGLVTSRMSHPVSTRPSRCRRIVRSRRRTCCGRPPCRLAGRLRSRSASDRARSGGSASAAVGCVRAAALPPGSVGSRPPSGASPDALMAPNLRRSGGQLLAPLRPAGRQHPAAALAATCARGSRAPWRDVASWAGTSAWS